ncbi:MAG: rhodanese-like domain-containing protein [Thiotrichaceae bacterium]|nr:rhodanese-like domain-containing protein [Thiotrichaceae bacterium]
MKLKCCQFFVVLSMLSGCSTNPQITELDPGCGIVEVIDQTLPIKTTTEVFDLLKNNGENILFVDVRTSGEASQGMPTPIDANIPIFEQKKDLEFNDNFITAIEDIIDEEALNKQNTLIMICSEGTRSKRAVKTLRQEGYKNVYSVKGGVHAWQDSHLPWSDANEIDIGTLYFSDSF